MSTLRQLIGRFKLQWRRKNHVVGWNMTPEKVITFFLSQRKTVLTFYGYSGMGYEDEEAMLVIARKVLSGYSPETTLVNIGVTSSGIGAIYPSAKSMGFSTTGIVTSLALDHPEGISDAVDHICFVTDQRWGGNLPDSNELCPLQKPWLSAVIFWWGSAAAGSVRLKCWRAKRKGSRSIIIPLT